RIYTKTENNENNSSVIIRFAINDISFVFPGDIEIPAELELLSYGKGMRTTVLKAPHHGSHSSSSVPFIDWLYPETVIFSCGKNNGYGFPVFEVLRRYEKIGAKIYRTDLHGNIDVITDGRNYRVMVRR
ncbi:ComEC/Rec2 family competence protein, partial [Elusimicrobiota bacterium]